MRRISLPTLGLCAFGVLLSAALAGAAVTPNKARTVGEHSYRHPDLYIGNVYARPADLPASARSATAGGLDLLGVPADQAFLDLRGGRWGTLLPAQPLIPGTANGLAWSSLGAAPPGSEAELRTLAWDAFHGYLAVFQNQLSIDPGDLPRPGRVTVQQGGDLIQIHAPRIHRGIPVRGAFVTGVVNHGNLVLVGTRNWGDVDVAVEPRLTVKQAAAAVRAHVQPYRSGHDWRRPHLVIVPTARGQQMDDVVLGQGYGHRLVWVLSPAFAGDHGRYEALVDAIDGELLSFEDTNQYASTREVSGGVLPVSNDGVAPDGVEQAGWPMPFADVLAAGGGSASCGNGVCEPNAGEDCLSCASDCRGVQNGNPNNRFCCGDGDGQNPVGCGDSRCTSAGFACDPNAGGGGAGGLFFTDSGGSVACLDGSVTSTLSGRTVSMNDNCGAISLASAGNLDFGTSATTDCSTPGFGGAGNTRASRSGFYELNRIQEMARGQLPGNLWLQDQLVANMNINLTCNAFWSGSTVNFYRSGGGCNNTGEIAGIFDHEWGHGMDDNDANPSISSPGEGIADIYAALRLNTSCIGRNFLASGNCGGYGDPCTDCSGVRDIDFANRASGQPHDIVFIDAACGSGGGTPCGGSTHCEGAVYAESVWDLVHRDLPAAGFDSNTALEIGTRLTYLGAGPVGNWYNCAGGTGVGDGCNADGGYLNYLAADDDNGNLADGTPHMAAIFAAFDRHGIACSSPTVQNGGCAGAPSSAPSVSAAAFDRGASLSWSAVGGADEYAVFRTDGVFACDFGKEKVGTTAGTSFIDAGLQNGRSYHYVVVPVGSADSCIGPGSSCTTVIPSPGANLEVDAASSSLALSGGDGDAFLDNCESGTMSFDILNIGTGSQSNVRLVDVVATSHPNVTVTTSFPSTVASSLADCGVGAGSFDFTAEGLSFNDTVEFRVDYTSDQLSPVVKSTVLTVALAESDLQSFASRTFSYEANREGWTTVQGTFDRTSAGGGAGGTSFYLTSSDNLPDRCDHVRSPVVRLSSTSTLSLSTQFDIEGVFQGSTWYDRANVGLYDVASGNRTAVSPSGGRAYNASGANGTCGTDGQAGWAGTAASWAASSWSAAALGSPSVAGDLVQLDVRYGTDPIAQGFGFHFDQVTLTAFDLQVADTLSDNCAAQPFCGDNVCNGNETQCSCAADCGFPPGSEVGLCTDGVDNDCDTQIDCADFLDCGGDPACSGPVCGNNVCEAGESCTSCSADCDSKVNGPKSGRFCCGDGIAQSAEGNGAICDGNF